MLGTLAALQLIGGDRDVLTFPVIQRHRYFRLKHRVGPCEPSTPRANTTISVLSRSRSQLTQALHHNIDGEAHAPLTRASRSRVTLSQPGSGSVLVSGCLPQQAYSRVTPGLVAALRLSALALAVSIAIQRLLRVTMPLGFVSGYAALLQTGALVAFLLQTGAQLRPVSAFPSCLTTLTRGLGRGKAEHKSEILRTGEPLVQFRECPSPLRCHRSRPA